MLTITTHLFDFLSIFFTAYLEGAKWFLQLMKALLWDNPVYFYTTSNWLLFFVYVIYLKKLIVGTVFETMTWERLFRQDFGGFKGLFIFIEWFVLIIGSISLFHSFLWTPYPEFWNSAFKFVKWIYVDGLKSAMGYHWTLGVLYFLIVDWCFGAAWPIHLTFMIHGDAPLSNFNGFKFDRNAQSQHNNFMQLVNIERAIGRIGKK